MASATGSDHTPSSSPNPGSSGDDSSRTNLIINYLPQNLTESELFKMFVTIGTVTNCKIMRDFRVIIKTCCFIPILFWLWRTLLTQSMDILDWIQLRLRFRQLSKSWRCYPSDSNVEWASNSKQAYKSILRSTTWRRPERNQSLCYKSP